MAKFQKQTPTPSLKDLDLTNPEIRKKVASRASKLRRKQRKGKELSPAELDLVTGWEQEKSGTGRTRVEASASAAADNSPESDSTSIALPASGETHGESGESDGTPPPPPKPKPSQPDKAPPPSAPRVLSGGKVTGDWREKYGGEAQGRESACREVATAWCMLLYSAVERIEELDASPVIGKEALQAGGDDEPIGEIFAASVLTADKLIPKDFEPGPEVTLAIGSSVIIGQRLIVGAKAKKKKKAEQATGTNMAKVVPIGSSTPLTRAEENRKAAEQQAEQEAQAIEGPPTKKPTDDEEEGMVF